MVAGTKPRFQHFLKDRGYKSTLEREARSEEILKPDGHFEGRRAVPLLVKAGLLKEVIHGGKTGITSISTRERKHDHLICLKCGPIIEFQDAPLRKAEEKVCQQDHFRPEKILVEILGY